MKRLIPAVAIVLGWASATWATEPAAPFTLTTLSAIHTLNNADALKHFPVDFEATVTYFRPDDEEVFVQDGDAAIYLFTTGKIKLAPGDRVRVRGVTQPSFRPIVQTNDITVLYHGDLPKSIPASYDELVRIQHDAMRVTVRAAVRSADVVLINSVRFTYLHMLADGGTVDASVQSGDGSGLKELLDAEVEVTGVASAIFDSKMQQTGVMLHSNTMADIKVLKAAGANPWTLPVTPMDTILAEYRVRDLTTRVRVHGTITYYQPGAAVVLQDGVKSIWIDTETSDPLQIGDVADANGFPDVHSGFLNLVRGEIQDSHVQAPIDPHPATWESLSTSDNVQFGHIYDLVSIEGQVVTETREAERDEYVLETNGHLFTAIYNHSDKATLVPLPPMRQIPIGTMIRVSGICIELSSKHSNGPVPFNILLRSFDDILVVASPTFLNVRNLMILVGILLAVVFAVGIRDWAIERRLRRHTAAMARIEQRRSLILEDINGSRPLTEIIEEIVELASFKLEGAACWCQTADGAHWGTCPAELTGMRIVRSEIPARSGLPLGTISAAFGASNKPSAVESEALSMAVGLATLALETRRLYSDLRHRSEYDLLTDIPNRFSLHRSLDVLIHETGPGQIFGLIYIDLDRFKPVNDKYGHYVGDLYLQAVAGRINNQLLTGDMLARLGGDEFAALVALPRGRADLDKIVQRISGCFDDPFVVEEHLIKGTASIGFALYPEDGVTKDALLIAADASMYEVKNRNHRNEVTQHA
ncbi:MAG: diguanylate cyclase [Terracidiphilus sp.]